MIFKANSATQLPSSLELKSATIVDFRQTERELNPVNRMSTSTELKSASQLSTSTEVGNDFSNPNDEQCYEKNTIHHLQQKPALGFFYEI